ncbi:MAG: recombination regulator RecX [Bacteroidetes bacterium]|nr:recombination regulator RecX [Bacteroidota bacterium]MCL5738976.1 recombination regulator RecX [Bacteroidota bacterium]
MRIVSIEKAHRGGKFKVCFEEEGELLLSKEVIVDFGLRRNDEISSERMQQIQDAQSYQDTYIAAMRLLNYQMRTTAELRQRLHMKEFPPGAINRVLDKLTNLGLVDDVRFAEAFIASKVASKPIGKRELERKLREKGVSKETASQALSDVSNDETQIEFALQAAEIKIRSLKRYELKKRREKLVAFLARRGFDWDVIRKVVRKMFDGDYDAVDI